MLENAQQRGIQLTKVGCSTAVGLAVSGHPLAADVGTQSLQVDPIPRAFDMTQVQQFHQLCTPCLLSGASHVPLACGASAVSRRASEQTAPPRALACCESRLEVWPSCKKRCAASAKAGVVGLAAVDDA